MGDPNAVKEWFVTHGGKQFGPVSLHDLKFEAERGQLDPGADMVWRQDMDDWVPSGDLAGLFPRAAEPAPRPIVLEKTEVPRADWPGASRSTYLAILFLLPLLAVVCIALARHFLGVKAVSATAEMAVYGVVLIAMVFVSISRLGNLGMSRWWACGLWIPILGQWLQFRSFAGPAGYAAHKKLGGLGWFLAILYWCFLILVVFAFVAFRSGFTPSEYREKLDSGSRSIQQSLKTLEAK